MVEVWLRQARTSGPDLVRIDAEDENGSIVYTLPFKHALSIIPELV